MDNSDSPVIDTTTKKHTRLDSESDILHNKRIKLSKALNPTLIASYHRPVLSSPQPVISNKKTSKKTEKMQTTNFSNLVRWPDSFSALAEDLKHPQTNFTVNDSINSKIVLYQGDITTLDCDVIVNAANSSLLPGGGVCGAIFSKSGSQLRVECNNIGFCETGNCVLTKSYDLPAKTGVIHAVGPFYKRSMDLENTRESLASCYSKSLELCKKKDIKSIAYCCISTGIYGYPNEDAAHVALSTVRNWLELNHESIDTIIFCTFLDIDTNIYKKFLPIYFPCK